MSNKVCVIINDRDKTIVLEDTEETYTYKPGREFMASVMYGRWGNRRFDFYEVLRSLIEERNYKMMALDEDNSIMDRYEKVYKIDCFCGVIECLKNIEGGYVLYKDGKDLR